MAYFSTQSVRIGPTDVRFVRCGDSRATMEDVEKETVSGLVFLGILPNFTEFYFTEFYRILPNFTHKLVMGKLVLGIPPTTTVSHLKQPFRMIIGL